MFATWATWLKHRRCLIVLMVVSLPLQATSPQPFWSHTIEALQSVLQKDFKQPIQLVASPSLYLPTLSAPAQIGDVTFDPHRKTFHANLRILTPSDTQEKAFVLTGQVQFLRSVPVLKQTLATRQTIFPDMVDWKLLTDDYRLKEAIPTEEDLQGAISKCALSPGDILSWKNIKTLSQIDRGSLVEIVYRSAGLQVALQGGRALASGRKGDTIPVSNPQYPKSQKPLFGVIENHRRVCINPAGPT